MMIGDERYIRMQLRPQHPDKDWGCVRNAILSGVCRTIIQNEVKRYKENIHD